MTLLRRTIQGVVILSYLATLDAQTPAGLVDAFLEAVRPVLAASAEGYGCAVAAVTLADAADLRQVAGVAFDSWIAALGGRLAALGLKQGDATDLATALITLLEGAHVLCRAAGTVGPFDHAARTAAVLSRAYAG